MYPDEGRSRAARVKKQVSRAKSRGRHNRNKQDAFVVQGTNDRMIQTIVANMDLIEVRVGEEDDTWDRVKDLEPTCSSWVLFPFSNYVLVPGHVIWGRGQGKKRWLTLVKNQKYTVLESELEFVKEIRGDIYLIKLPDVAPKRNILSHFADSISDFGRYNHVVPHVYDTGYNQVTASGWENSITMVELV